MKIYLNRRHFIKIGTQAAVACLLPISALSSINRLLSPERTLFLFNPNTGERLDVCYYTQGQYQPKALKKINNILRDYRTGEIKPIHKSLLDLLHSISMTLDNQPQFHIISGYRSLKTNAMLYKTTECVAKNSLHTQGKAADIRIPGYDTGLLRDICMKLRSGGVGYYPKSDFVHVDIGRVRSW